MNTVVVEYTVKDDCVEENKQFVEAVFKMLNESKPDGLRYMTFIKDDGKTFMHVASIEGETNPLPETDAFKAFQKDLKDRCEVPPKVTKLDPVGSYKFFD